MTGAEFKTLRESLGLSVAQAATLVKVKERTVNYWEAGQNPIPEAVGIVFTQIDAQLENMVQQVKLQFQDAAGGVQGKPDEVVLLRYKTDLDLHACQQEFTPLPATCHAAMLGRVRRALQGLGVTVRIVYFDRVAFDAWAASKALPENAGTRAAWAGEQVA